MSVYEYDYKLDAIAPDDFMELIEKKGIKPEMIHKAMEALKHHTVACSSQKQKAVCGIPGPPCPYCDFEFYHRTGVCLTCSNCGESSSCG